MNQNHINHNRSPPHHNHPTHTPPTPTQPHKPTLHNPQPTNTQPRHLLSSCVDHTKTTPIPTPPPRPPTHPTTQRATIPPPQHTTSKPTPLPQQPPHHKQYTQQTAPTPYSGQQATSPTTHTHTTTNNACTTHIIPPLSLYLPHPCPITDLATPNSAFPSPPQPRDHLTPLPRANPHHTSPLDKPPDPPPPPLVWVTGHVLNQLPAVHSAHHTTALKASICIDRNS